ncbi:MAG: signal recognition particle protein [Candidatus Aenigmarchaeota archaeon]|nr:signal recognition particle protein [Candidatus Aenigmarchaeota archaeon]
MVLEKMKNGLRRVIEKITSSGSINKQVIDEIVKDLQRTLLESDVDVELVFELSERIRKRALEEKPKPGLTAKEHVVQVLYDELVKILGEGREEIKPGKILLIGLFGSGKTSTAAKLAHFYQKKGFKVALIGCDTFRPAAQDQIEQLAKSINVPYYINKNEKDSSKVAMEGLEKFKSYDVLIFDSSGRDALDEDLADELKKLKDVINPDETLLVIPADIGQAVGEQAREFNGLVKITGIIVTKLDATAKGGGALTSAKISNAPVIFITTGEKVDDLEIYDPKRFVARLIGFGDLESLLEKVKEVAKPEVAEKIIKENFDLNDFVEQIESVQKVGTMDKILDMLGLSIPLSKKISPEALNVQEEKMKKWKHIVNSMTPEERGNPEIINSSRVRRITKGSGTSEEDVRELLASYKKTRKMMKILKPGKMKDPRQLTRLLKGRKLF